MAGRPRTNTNLNLYRSFCAAYETKSVRKAAEITGTTHSAVSQNLKELGRQLGVKLFFAQARGVQPTGESDAIYPTIRKMISGLDSIENKIKVFGPDSPGIIKIACTTSYSGFYVANFINKFRKTYPKVEFDIIHASKGNALDMLEKAHVHLVFSVVPNNWKNTPSTENITLTTLDPVFFASTEYAKNNGIGATISKEKFEELPFISLRTLSHYFDDIKTPDIIAELQDTLLQLVRSNEGVSFGFEQALDIFTNKQEIVRFKVAGLEARKANLICSHSTKTELPNAAKAFITIFNQ